MFTNLKNKIKEEIGTDVVTVVRNARTVHGLNNIRHRSQNSLASSSVSGSQVSLNDIKEENILTSTHVNLKREDSCELKLEDGTPLSAKDIKKLVNREDEWRKRFQKKEEEFNKRLEKKEEEWKRILDKYEKEKAKLKSECSKIENDKKVLEITLSNVEDYKKKLYTFQENADQIEGFQSQEMAKIKHLLLTKEQEVEEKSQRLKASFNEIEILKAEVSRLRRYEDELNNVQEKSSKEIKELENRMKEFMKTIAEKDSSLLETDELLKDERSKNSVLQKEILILKKELENEKLVKANLEKEKIETDKAMITNDLMVKEESQIQKLEYLDLKNHIKELERNLNNKEKEAEEVSSKLEHALNKINEFEKIKNNTEVLEDNEKILKTSITDLEEQLNDKTKTIKILQQRLSDMKKTLQNELKVPAHSLDNETKLNTAVISPSSSTTVTTKQNVKEDDVNFQYLKHVIMKFLTSREYEALNLTRAVATLLHLTKEEEKLLQETLEWKMSWFGTRPNLGFGQTAKAIPPS